MAAEPPPTFAGAAAEARALCLAVDARQGPPTAGQPMRVLVLVQPRLALQTLCHEQLAEGAAPQAMVQTLLDVAAAAIGSGKVVAAGRVIDSLQSEAGGIGQELAADTRAQLHLLAAQLAHERLDKQREGDELALAHTVLTAAGLVHSARFAEVLVAQAALWRHLRASGGLERAANALDEAAALLRALGLDPSLDMINVLNERVVLANARQDLPGSLAAAYAERAMYRQLGHAETPPLLDVQASIGALLSQLNRLPEAASELEAGVRLIDLHPDEDPAAALGVLTNLATTYNDLGRPAQALPVAQRAFADARRIFGAESPRIVRPLMVMGSSLTRLARYAGARASLEEAQRIAALHADDVGPLRRLDVATSLSAVLVLLGENAQARTAIEQGLQLAGSGPHFGYWQGRLLLRRAALAARDGDWAEADAAAAQAADVIGPVMGARNPSVLDIGSHRCFAQASGGLPGDACFKVSATLNELDQSSPELRFRALAALANDDEHAGRSDDALRHHLQALAAAQSFGAPDPLWMAYAALAMHLHGRGSNAVAILLAKQSVEQIEAMRALLGADAKRFERGFLSDKLGVYRRLADWLTEDGRIDEALQVLRRLKEEEFLDFVSRDGGLHGAIGGGPAYTAQEGTLRQRWLGADKAAAAASAASDAATVLQREADAVARWQQQLDPIARAPSAAAPRGAAVDRAARQSGPPIGELWVWVYPGEHRVNLVMDAPRQRSVDVVTVAPASLVHDVTQLLDAIERREPVLQRLQALHRLIGAPVERAAAAAGARRIVFVIDGPLRYLPFASLHDGRGYLGDRYSVEQRVPLPVVAPMRATAIGSSVQALGVSRALAGMAPLNHVAGEICGIVAGPVQGLVSGDGDCSPDGRGHGAMHGSAWMNDTFTAERLQTVAAGATAERGRLPPTTSLLHIGTHFVLRPGRIGRSWLLLGDGRQLSLDALAQYDFRGQALVTLSACETGIGGIGGLGGTDGDDAGTQGGEQIDGLGGVLLRRGAGAVIASLWRVADASTSLLMQRLYRHLAAGAQPAEALRAAQADLRAGRGRWAHPFHWAGFYLIEGMP